MRCSLVAPPSRLTLWLYSFLSRNLGRDKSVRGIPSIQAVNIYSFSRSSPQLNVLASLQIVHGVGPGVVPPSGGFVLG